MKSSILKVSYSAALVLMLVLSAFDIKAQNPNEQLWGQWRLESVQKQQLNASGNIVGHTTLVVASMSSYEQLEGVITAIDAFDKSMALNFASNKSLIGPIQKAYFEVNGDRVSVTLRESEPEQTLIFTFVIQGDKLTLTSIDAANTVRTFAVYAKLPNY